MGGLLAEQTGVEVAEHVEHVAAHVDEVVDACGLELVHAGWCAGHYKLSAAVEGLEGFGGESGILVV